MKVTVTDFGDANRHEIRIKLKVKPGRLLTAGERRDFKVITETVAGSWPGVGNAPCNWGPIVEPVLYKKTERHIGRKERERIARAIQRVLRLNSHASNAFGTLSFVS